MLIPADLDVALPELCPGAAVAGDQSVASLKTGRDCQALGLFGRIGKTGCNADGSDEAKVIGLAPRQADLKTGTVRSVRDGLMDNDGRLTVKQIGAGRSNAVTGSGAVGDGAKEGGFFIDVMRSLDRFEDVGQGMAVGYG